MSLKVSYRFGIDQDQEEPSGYDKLNFVKDTTRKEVFRRVNLAREYIRNNYDQKFRLEDVAHYSCLSVNHLLKNFKQAYQISPYQYLISIRLNRAKLLLEEGNYSVNETVMLIGFESSSSFIRLFKFYFNCTPLKFKKKNIHSYKLIKP